MGIVFRCRLSALLRLSRIFSEKTEILSGSRRQIYGEKTMELVCLSKARSLLGASRIIFRPKTEYEFELRRTSNPAFRQPHYGYDFLLDGNKVRTLSSNGSFNPPNVTGRTTENDSIAISVIDLGKKSSRSWQYYFLTLNFWARIAEEQGKDLKLLRTRNISILRMTGGFSDYNYSEGIARSLSLHSPAGFYYSLQRITDRTFMFHRGINNYYGLSKVTLMKYSHVEFGAIESGEIAAIRSSNPEKIPVGTPLSSFTFNDDASFNKNGNRTGHLLELDFDISLRVKPKPAEAEIVIIV